MLVLVGAAHTASWLRIQVVLSGKPDESLQHNIQLTA
jgi:primosomal replication protein N